MKSTLLIGIALTCFSSFVTAGSIYKCSKKDGTVSFTDKPCPELKMEVIHQETELEKAEHLLKSKTDKIIRMIRDNQIEAAKVYAAEQDLLAVYENALTAHKTYLEIKQKQDTLAAEQRYRQIQQEQINLQQSLLLQAQQLEMQSQQNALNQEQSQQQQSPYYYYPGYYLPTLPPCPPHTKSHPNCWPSPPYNWKQPTPPKPSNPLKLHNEFDMSKLKLIGGL